MKIILLIDSLHSIAAGSERQIYKLAEGLANAGHEVTLTLLRATTFSKGLDNFPCPIQCLDISSIASIDASKKMLAFRKKIHAEHIDVVHAYFPDACLLAPLWLKSRHTTIITSRRDMGLIYQGKPAWLYRALGVRTDYIVSNSSAVAEFIAAKEHLPAAKSVVIYNGLEDFHHPDNQHPNLFKHSSTTKFILVANIKPVKRTLDAIIATKLLRDQGETLELALVGEAQDPGYTQMLRDYIAQHQLEDCVYLTGSIKEPRNLLSQADVGLLVSESEGLSNTIMEYMQLGLPVIATAVGGNPELVHHESTGLLVPKAEPKQLALAMETLIRSPELRQTYGRQGKDVIQQGFSIAAMIHKHEQLYQNNTAGTP